MARKRETTDTHIGDCPEELVLLLKEPRAFAGDKEPLLTSFAKVFRPRQRLSGPAVVASRNFAVQEGL